MWHWAINWLVILLITFAVFTVFGFLSPLTLVIDRLWKYGNEIGRPFIDTLIISGVPAVFAKFLRTPCPYFLIPITFFLTQYAVLSGRFLNREFNVAGWTMLISFAGIWSLFFIF